MSLTLCCVTTQKLRTLYSANVPTFSTYLYLIIHAELQFCIYLFLFLSAPPDYLVCGNCSKQFPLASMPAFIQHKKLDCNDSFSTIGEFKCT